MLADGGGPDPPEELAAWDEAPGLSPGMIDANICRNSSL